jgi:hypothetical protein
MAGDTARGTTTEPVSVARFTQFEFDANVIEGAAETN